MKNHMLPSIIFMIISSVITLSSGTTYERDNDSSFPLLDGIKASWKADIDIPDLNKKLENYITKKVQEEVSSALDKEVQNIIFTKVEQAINDIQKEKRVAFTAVLSEENDKVTMKKNEVVVFDNAILNDGNAYDNRTGKFRCPKRGQYFFSWTVLSEPNSDFSSELAVNGEPYFVNIVDNDKTEDHLTSTASLTVSLSSGDEVYIRAHESEGRFMQSTWTNGEPASVFTGFSL